MSDQLHLLSHGIPAVIAGVLVIFLVIGATGSIWGVKRGLDGGENILRATAGLLSLIGMAVAAYVVWTAVIQLEIPQCVGGGGGCGVVEHSKYSNPGGLRIDGHPVFHMGTIGLIGYSVILAATVMKGDFARLAAFFLSLFGFCFSLYLTYLELWEILAICQWCVTSAVAMTMIFLVSTCRLIVFYGTDDPDPEAAAGRSSAA